MITVEKELFTPVPGTAHSPNQLEAGKQRKKKEEKRWSCNQNSGSIVYLDPLQCSLVSLRNQDSFFKMHYCASISESHTWLAGITYHTQRLDDTAYGF